MFKNFSKTLKKINLKNKHLKHVKQVPVPVLYVPVSPHFYLHTTGTYYLENFENKPVDGSRSTILFDLILIRTYLIHHSATLFIVTNLDNAAHICQGQMLTIG